MKFKPEDSCWRLLFHDAFICVQDKNIQVTIFFFLVFSVLATATTLWKEKSSSLVLSLTMWSLHGKTKFQSDHS